MIKQWIVLALFFVLGPVYAQSSNQVNRLIQRQNYPEALKMLKQMAPSAERSFQLGVTYKYLGEFKQSAQSFQDALARGYRGKSINFEYGQTLYGDNELTKALAQFKKSYERGYEVGTSLYYLGYINQVLENYIDAKTYFSKLTTEKGMPPQMVQVGLFQLGEVLLSLAERKGEDLRRRVEQYVLPKWESAKAVSPKSAVAKDIDKRQEEVRKKYGLHPDYYQNGKKIKGKRYRLKARQKFEYDSNITLTSDDPTVLTAEADSFISTSKVTGNYLWVFDQKYFVEPDISLSKTKHSDQDTATVFSNDQYNVKGGVSTGMEYTLMDKVTSTSFGVSYGYRSRDRLSRHDHMFDSRSLKFEISHRMRIWGPGDTSLSISRNNISSAVPAADIYSNSVTISQLFFLRSNILLNALWSSVYTVLPNAPANDGNTHVANLTAIFLEVMPKYTLTLNMGVTFQNTINQENRGTEKTYAPSVRLDRRVGKDLLVSLSYKVTEKTSKVKTNAYEKTTTSFELVYDF